VSGGRAVGRDARNDDPESGMTSNHYFVMTDAYAEHVLEAADVCNNCLRLIRVERVDPVRSGVAREFEATFERERRHTSVEYAPADAISEHKGVFCECGVEGARDRIWSGDTLPRDRFKTLVKHLLQTLDRKGVTVTPRETAAYALQAYDDDAAPDQALARAVDAGIVAAAASDSDDDPSTVRVR